MITRLRPIGSGIDIGGAEGTLVRIGDTPSYKCLDEVVSDGDTTCVEVTAVGETIAGRLYTFEQLPVSFRDKVKSVSLVAVAKEVTGGTKTNLSWFLFQSGLLLPSNTEPNGSGTEIHADLSGVIEYTSYRYTISTALDEDSLPVPWSRNTINSTQYGWVISAEDSVSRITQLYVEIEHEGCKTGVTTVPPPNVEDGTNQISVSALSGPSVSATGPMIVVRECE